MPNDFTRRSFVRTAALTSILPSGLFADTAAPQRVVIRTDEEIGVVRPEFHGHFAEHLGSCVYGGLWVGLNSSVPNINGYRKAAVEYLKELGIPVLRWPGGCFADDYHWRDGIGPPSKRPKRVNIHWGNYTEDNSFGVHEFMGLCKLLGSEPYMAANLGSGSPREMRDWVEYCNYPSGSTLSDERAANGSPEPFNVKYWGVGNENWGCGGNMTPDHYANLYRQFAGYVRTFGDLRPFLIACGPNGNDTRWSRHFLDGIAGSRMPDGFAMHFYENGDLYPTEFTADAMDKQLATFQRVEQAIVQQRALLDGYDPQRKTGLLLDEWGVWDKMNREEERTKGKLYQQSTIRSAIGAALGLNIFNRQADKLVMCNIAQIVNVLQSLLLTDSAESPKCVRTATYYAFRMFRDHRSKVAVKTDSAVAGPLDISVSASRGNGEIVVTLVNPKHDTDVRIDCALPQVKAQSVSALLLHHENLNAANTFDQPDAVVAKAFDVRIDGGSLRFDLPRLSIMTARIKVT
jgi:alpha-N-arabinofuranosidase